jgi:hypothetical protein
MIPDTVAKLRGQGALADLDKNKYSFESLKYPQEVGTNEVPHFVLFNINVAEHSRYIAAGGGKVENVQSASQDNYDLRNNIKGIFKLDKSTVGNASAAGGVLGGLSGVADGKSPLGAAGRGLVVGAQAGASVVAGSTVAAELKPKTLRIKKSISIYMPDTVISSYDHDWQGFSLTEAIGKGYQYAALGAGGRSLGSRILAANGDFSSLDASYGTAQEAETLGFATETLGVTGPGFTDLALKSVNAAINPLVELVFKGTANRGYVFEFQFQPRSAKESTIIQEIIRTFRTYAAPEISKEGGGRYFIPPASFDIKFYFKNVENDNIAKISTCVLTNIAVNYSGAGAYATFTDGQPVQINLMLTFKETDVITRELIDNFGY